MVKTVRHVRKATQQEVTVEHPEEEGITSDVEIDNIFSDQTEDIEQDTNIIVSDPSAVEHSGRIQTVVQVHTEAEPQETPVTVDLPPVEPTHTVMDPFSLLMMKMEQMFNIQEQSRIQHEQETAKQLATEINNNLDKRISRVDERIRTLDERISQLDERTQLSFSQFSKEIDQKLENRLNEHDCLPYRTTFKNVKQVTQDVDKLQQTHTYLETVIRNINTRIENLMLDNQNVIEQKCKERIVTTFNTWLNDKDKQISTVIQKELPVMLQRAGTQLIHENNTKIHELQTELQNVQKVLNETRMQTSRNSSPECVSITETQPDHYETPLTESRGQTGNNFNPTRGVTSVYEDHTQSLVTQDALVKNSQFQKITNDRNGHHPIVFIKGIRGIMPKNLVIEEGRHHYGNNSSNNGNGNGRNHKNNSNRNTYYGNQNHWNSTNYSGWQNLNMNTNGHGQNNNGNFSKKRKRDFRANANYNIGNFSNNQQNMQPPHTWSTQNYAQQQWQQPRPPQYHNNSHVQPPYNTTMSNNMQQHMNAQP
ncbi:myb-like protein I [Schistocerca americana]|uniref:myb-like protein I n=1 Tax=Schistocerca americana TaxID=7009 RepID=UPI001F4F38DC|nr:myb-like protein I [Schistocerca americana]